VPPDPPSERTGHRKRFVVLAEVSALQRLGKDIISFCIGQPDFHTRKTSATRASRR